jgi:hypothetical protein
MDEVELVEVVRVAVVLAATVGGGCWVFGEALRDLPDSSESGGSTWPSGRARLDLRLDATIARLFLREGAAMFPELSMAASPLPPRRLRVERVAEDIFVQIRVVPPNVTVVVGAMRVISICYEQVLVCEA